VATVPADPEGSGVLVRLPGQGWSGATSAGLPLTVRIRAAETGGTLSVVEIDEDPRHTARLHRHQNAEAWYVVQGEYALCVERQWYRAPEGTLIFVPGGVSHGFAVLRGEPARKLSMAIPGGSEDQYLTDVADRADAPAPEPAGIESVPPDW
jgi:quercetin dioxygenase-like cupin family protein